MTEVKKEPEAEAPSGEPAAKRVKVEQGGGSSSSAAPAKEKKPKVMTAIFIRIIFLLKK